MNKQEALKACTVDGLVVKLPAEQLERNVYLEVAKSLQLIGGKWKGGKVFGFQFPSDPSALLAQVANGEKRNLQKEYQFFPTPDDIADWLVQLAAPKKGELILEPSAGQGAIVGAILRGCPYIKKVDCCELMDINQTFLRKIKGANIIADDFLDLLHYHHNVYDVIIANPPFSNNQDIDHIRQMYKCLKPGGRLVSVASVHWLHSENKKETEFGVWLADLHALTYTIDAGKFKESGTMVGAKVITLTKPAKVESTPVGANLSVRPEPAPVRDSKTITIRHQDRKERIIADMQAIIDKAILIPIKEWHGHLITFEEFVNQQSNTIWQNPKRLAECTSEFIGKNGFNEMYKGKSYDFHYGTGIYQVGKASMLPIVLYQIKKDWGNGESKPVKTKPRIPFDISANNAINAEIHRKAIESGTLPMPIKEPVRAKQTVRPKQVRAKQPVRPEPAPKIKPVKPVNPVKNFELLKYSPKCFALFGDTKPIKDDLRNLGGSYCPYLTHNKQRMGGWVFPVKREKDLRQYLAS